MLTKKNNFMTKQYSNNKVISLQQWKTQQKTDEQKKKNPDKEKDSKTQSSGQQEPSHSDFIIW